VLTRWQRLGLQATFAALAAVTLASAPAPIFAQQAPQPAAPQPAAPQGVPPQTAPQATPLPQAAPQPRRGAPAPALRASAPVTVNFVNADIEAVTRAMAVMIERQIIVDPRVKGTITVYSEQPMSVREAYLNYLAALRGLGFTLVDSAGLLKVVPEADAKLQAGTVQIGAPGTRGDQVLTQIFKLNHENPNNLVAVLRPLISPNNTINANPGNNTLVITDYADNLQRIGKIIAALDQPSATDVEVIPLKYAVASDVAQLVQRMTDSSGAAAAPGTAAAAALSVMRCTRVEMSLATTCFSVITSTSPPAGVSIAAMILPMRARLSA